MSLSRGYLALWRSLRLGCRRPPLLIVSFWSEKDCPFADRSLILGDVFFRRSLLISPQTCGRAVRTFLRMINALKVMVFDVRKRAQIRPSRFFIVSANLCSHDKKSGCSR